MKKIIFVAALLFAHRAFSMPEWLTDSFTQKNGDCKTGNLAFSALRISKIDLHKKFQDKDVYLRVVLFLQPDGNYSARFNEQALLGCSINNSGEEVCGYKILTDAWTAGVWNFDGASVKVTGLGVMTKNSDIRYRDYQILFEEGFAWPQAAGQSFMGPVILVNFDSTGKNSSVICRQP